MNSTMRIASSLLVLVLWSSGMVAAQPAPEEASTLEGILTMLVGDPNPAVGGRSKRLYILNSGDGDRRVLDVSGAKVSAADLRSMRNKRIAIKGVVDKATSSVEVREMRLLASAEEKISGSRPFLSVLCKFGGNASEPRPPPYFLGQLGNAYPGFNHYFREVSYGALNLDGSAVMPAWVNMPNPRTFYIDGVKKSEVFLDELFRDCTNAAASMVDFSRYYGVNLMFNDVLDDAAWGGSSVHTLAGIEKAWPATWMPYLGETDDFGWRKHAVLAHEMSHAFGAPHSESPDGDEYGSLWDAVSSIGGTCSVTDATYGCVGQSMNAAGKVTMEILPANRQVIHSGGTQTYVIERLTQPPTPTSGQMVRIAVAGSTTRFYTVESRFRIGYDLNLPGDGVIIHAVDATKDRPARLVSPAGSGTGLGGAQAIWSPGSTFNSTADGVSVKVDSFAADGTATVTVSGGAASTGGGNTPGALSGLWWNANESGWGIHFTQRSTNIFAAWYTYDSAGSPKWYVASNCAGATGTSGTCTGVLYQVSGPAFFGAAFNPGAVQVSPAGNLQVQFQNANTASMTYTVGTETRTVAIARQPLGGGAIPGVDYTDLWWNPGESGWGLAIAQQGANLFLAWYVYDNTGKPVWYVASNCAVSGAGCTGTLYRTTGPAFGPTFNPAAVQVFTAGTVTLTFSDANNGTISYTVDGASGTKAITRQLF